MGRRKIEIQPIIHERNRSVTFLKASMVCLYVRGFRRPSNWNECVHGAPVDSLFELEGASCGGQRTSILWLCGGDEGWYCGLTALQRKNGLFKKAYELGVLCSVDVAVIIFEQRPGHNVKLYQYCSGDVDAQIRRHLSFDGDKDTRGPADFSGNTTAKMDDAAEPDDDDQEEEEEVLSSLGKRGRDSSKTGGELKIDVTALSKHTVSSRLNTRNRLITDMAQRSSGKKARIAPMMGTSSRTSSDIPGSYSYAPPPSSMRNTGAGNSTYGGPSSYYPPISTPTSYSGGGYDAFEGSRASSRMYGDFRPPPPPGRGGDPFGLLDPDDTRQMHPPATQYGGLEWPVHNSSSTSQIRGSTSGESSGSPSTSNNWLDLMGAGRVARGERERPDSRGRLVGDSADTVKKET
ncbi:Protein phosphatase [Mycena kentingensis (nom. inval.)]|nr:Protein phosphatase [Mycena kentingensis (nom. inval.)]